LYIRKTFLFRSHIMVKIAINGFGRIGRPTLKRILDHHHDLEVVAINDLTDSATLAHLLKYDSSYGIYPKSVSSTKDSLLIDGKEIKVFAKTNPETLPWKEMDIDIILECTGVFRDFNGAEKHLRAGVKKVIISAPSKSDRIPSYLLGVNAEEFNPEKDHIVDMGSCTTNCLAPVAKILNDSFGITKGFMTTIHSYTNDQKILDLPHKDLRRARTAGINIIPTTTGATKAIGKVIPSLQGKLNGIAMRVPTPVVSVIDLVCQLDRGVTADEVNKVFRDFSQDERYKGILGVEEAPLVSSDFKGNTFSSIIDAGLTSAKDNLVKVISWYDNEYGYACRLAEFAEFVGKKL